MARDYAQLKMSLLGDPGWRRLSAPAQHLYVILLAHETLNYVGVADWRPARLMPLARDWSEAAFFYAAVDLADQGWVVIDVVSEEVMIRSFLRHDNILKQPRLAVSMTKAYAGVSSETIRACIVHELVRLRIDRPGLAAWGDDRVLDILEHPSVDGKTISGRFDPPQGIDFSGQFGPSLGVDLPQTLPDASGLPTTSTSTPTPTHNLQPEPKALRPVDNPWAVNG